MNLIFKGLIGLKINRIWRSCDLWRMGVAVVAVLAASAGASVAAENRDFALGGDISATTHLESQSIYSYNSEGVRTENTRLMKDLGMDAVRLRVWVDPEGGWSSKEDVLEMARRAKALDMDIMIDFHYSDWWADPAKQNIPAAWKDFDYEQMKQAVASHTAETLQLLKDNGIDVRWVQVGNETSNGFLWPMGNAYENMAQYAGLTQAGYDAVKSVYPDATVIVHLDNGFDQNLYDRIFDGLAANGAKWDMIGVSVYPYWAIMYNHRPDEDSVLAGTIDNIRHLAEKYGCDVMIVETGVEAAKPEEGYRFMTRLIDAALNDTDGHCRGVFYWAPECCHGGYELGAFQNDRPTKILDAFTEARDKLSNK